MRMKPVLFLMVNLLLFCAGESFAQEKGLRVVVTDLKSDAGQVGVLVFKDESGYPNDHRKAVARAFGAIRENKAEITVQGLDHGTYVVTVMHDENTNEKLDKDLFGRPKEGYGVSNNPPPRTFGPPRFEDGLIDFRPGNAGVTIKMRYD